MARAALIYRHSSQNGTALDLWSLCLQRISQMFGNIRNYLYLCIVKTIKYKKVNIINMAITEERLRQTFSEGGAQEIYQEVKASGDFLGFAHRYAFNQDYRVARSSLWGLTKASKEELSQLQVIQNEFIDQAMQTDNSSVRRLSLNVVERLKMSEDDLRTDFLDFCFEHMLDVEEYPGIQSVCMKLAFRMCSFYPELMDELKRTLEAIEIDYYKPAVKCVRNRILNGRLK